MRKIFLDIETDGIISHSGMRQTFPNMHLICIYDSETDKYLSFKEDELKGLWPILESADMLIGFNSEFFDIPILNRYYSGDLSRIRGLDILSEIKKSYGRRMKLDQLAEGTLGEKKSGDGLQALTWWRNGDYQRVIEYCIKDVRITKDIYEYAMKNQELKFKEGGKIITFPINTSMWEVDTSSSLTHTLPF